MTGSTKQKTLLIFGLVFLVTILIAASLPQLELQPGMPLPELGVGQIVITQRAAQPVVEISVSRFLIIFFSLILGGLMLYVGYKLFSGADWKTLTSFIPPVLAVSILIVGVIFFILMIGRKGNIAPVPNMPMPTPEPLPTAPLGPVPPILIWIVGICLALTGIVIGIWSFKSAFRKPGTMDALGLEAEIAWKALQTGVDLKDVVVRCYQQMSLALEQEQGVEREDFMTTREFESLLEKAGAPREPVHQLTRLFEAVRYGHWKANPNDEQTAIRSLEAIMRYSREAQKGRTK